MKIKKIFCAETYCALYLVLFSLLAPITHTTSSGSTLFIAIPTLLLVIFSLLTKRTSKILSYKYFFILSFFISIVVFFDLALRSNPNQGNYLYNFVIYGAIPVFLFSRVANYYKLLKLYCILACIVGVVHLYDPIQGYEWNSNYMVYGINVMLPAFICSVVLSFYFKYKYAYILNIIFFFALVLGANKSTILAAIPFVLYAYAVFRFKKFKIKNVLMPIALILFGVIFLVPILSYFSSIAEKIGFESYSLITFGQMLYGLDSGSMDSRSYIWDRSLFLINQAPIFGHGLGYFGYKFDGLDYEHNLYLEILGSHGFVGLIVYIIIFINSIKALLRIKDKNRRVLAVTFLFMWFIPTLTSLSYWKIMPFWLYFAVCFCNKKLNISADKV